MEAQASWPVRTVRPFPPLTGEDACASISFLVSVLIFSAPVTPVALSAYAYPQLAPNPPECEMFCTKDFHR